MVDHKELSAVLAEFARTMLTEFPIQSILDHLVGRIVDILPITSAGVTLIAMDKAPQHIAASNKDALRFVRLQTEVREGPCLAAYESQDAVSVADLEIGGRFPIFTERAVHAGLRAVFSLPLRHDDGCLGALDLYRKVPGALDEEALEVAQTLADVATAYLLNIRAREEVEAMGDRYYHSALHDPLTSLPNRRLLQERMEQAAQRARRSRTTAAVLFADLDRFKVVNDTHGHQIGDELLVAVARRLSTLVRGGDTLARVSGDEFVFLCEDLSDESDAERLAGRVNATFDEPFELRGLDSPIAITASVGIAYAGPGAEISDQLLVEADMAMYQVKRRGGGGHQVIDMREALRTMDLQQLEHDLRSALEGDGLAVRYQPILHTANGLTAGVEALLRWNHPTRGPIPPPTIIQVAEQSGLISKVGEWILERACRDYAGWRAVDTALDIHLAVNVSARQLLDPQFEERVSEILERTGMDPASLVLEVTESIFVEDDGSAGKTLTALARDGIRLAMDDFGTGYSSLSYLCRLPIDIVKIDRSFIADLDHTDTSAIVAAITGLAHDLDLEIVAEGVETQDQAHEVLALGCHYSQGFLFARPMSAGDIGARLTAERVPDSARVSARPLPREPGEITTKRTLSVLSQVVEDLAEAAGSTATLVAMFQRGEYFAPVAQRYERLARTGVTVVVGYAAPGPTVEGPVVIEFGQSHPLRDEWSILLITPAVAAHVLATDLNDLEPTEPNPEDGRMFSASWGFDRMKAASHLQRLVADLDETMEPKLRSHLIGIARRAAGPPLTRSEHGLATAARTLVDRVELDQRTLSGLRAALLAKDELA